MDEAGNDDSLDSDFNPWLSMTRSNSNLASHMQLGNPNSGVVLARKYGLNISDMRKVFLTTVRSFNIFFPI